MVDKIDRVLRVQIKLSYFDDYPSNCTRNHDS